MPRGPGRKRSSQYSINMGESPEAKAVKEKYDSCAERFGFKDKRNTNRNKDFMRELLENYECRHIKEQPAKVAKSEPHQRLVNSLRRGSYAL